MVTAMLGLLPSAAWAADAAESVPIGYSADSRYFAFEQWGIQDGSGFAYSSIFVIDLAANAWVDGTPFRVMTEDESAKAGAARKKAYAAAAPTLDRLGIAEPATVLAAAPATQIMGHRNALTFDRYYRSAGPALSDAGSGLFDAMRFRLELGTKNLTPAADCYGADGPYKGFSLTLTDLHSGKAHGVHNDSALPKSRGCPLGYDLDKVVAPATAGPLVAIVGVYTFGFEGQDRRYLAVPFSTE